MTDERTNGGGAPRENGDGNARQNGDGSPHKNDEESTRENGDRDALLGDEEIGESGEDGVEPVEVLVQLAREGEIDPWDIDIVAVTDKFLARLDDSDLRTSGRALFYASVLLRMKGDALMQADDEPEEPEPEPWDVDGEVPAGDPVDALESEMDRRLDRKRVRGSPETLEELVRELREHERRRWWKEARTYDTSGSPRGFRRGTQTLDYHAGDDGRLADEPTEADVTGTAHDEDIEAVIEAVHAAVREQYEKGREAVLYREIAETGGSRVLTYLALLFLAHRGHVHLRQDELFGDLYVRDPAAVATGEEAVAD